MNDLEQRLKDVLETDAAKAPRVPRAPEGLKRQVRRRQFGTALVGAVAVVAVLGVSVVGMRTLDRSQGTTPVDDPWADYQVFERTARIENFTITSPSDVYSSTSGHGRSTPARTFGKRPYAPGMTA